MTRKSIGARARGKFERYRRCELISKATSAEKLVARELNGLGVHFVLQYPIRSKLGKLFYADIYIPELKLILEVDGAYHETKEQKRKDGNRSSVIRSLGLHVYRITNSEARRAGAVAKKIASARKKLIK